MRQGAAPVPGQASMQGTTLQAAFFVSQMECTHVRWPGKLLLLTCAMRGAYIKDDEVEEDKEHMHHDAHDQLQLADNATRILQGVCQILALLVDLQAESCWLHASHFATK